MTTMQTRLAVWSLGGALTCVTISAVWVADTAAYLYRLWREAHAGH